MKIIPCNTIEEFEILQNKINQAMLDNIPGYNQGLSQENNRWCNPTLVNSVTNKIACSVKLDGIHGLIIKSVLTESEINNIIEILQDDESWFPKINLGGI